MRTSLTAPAIRAHKVRAGSPPLVMVTAYDAPGARPPQSVLLAMPPRLDQDAWTFDDLMDVIHEAFDLAQLRTVRPRELAGGLGALLPARENAP